MPADFVFELGEPGPMRDRLIEAVRAGEKTATSSLRAQYDMDGECLPVVGEEHVVIDSRGRPTGHVTLTDVSVIRLGDADGQLASDEGEGFRTAEDWRRAHESFWRTYILADLPADFELSDDTEVVVERFKFRTDLA